MKIKENELFMKYQCFLFFFLTTTQPSSSPYALSCLFDYEPISLGTSYATLFYLCSDF